MAKEWVRTGATAKVSQPSDKHVFDVGDIVKVLTDVMDAANPMSEVLVGDPSNERKWDYIRIGDLEQP